MVNTKNNDLKNVENLETSKPPQVTTEEEKTEGREIDELRSEVDKMSKELKTAVNELKKSIVDIRSAVTEIENPFNLLRVITSEKDLKKLNSDRLPPKVKSLKLGKPERETPGEKLEGNPPFFEEKPPTLGEAQPPTETETRELQLEPHPQFPEAGTDYLDWVWSHIDLGLSSDDILQLAKSCEFMGYLPDNSAEFIYSLAIACEKAKLKGVSKRQILLSLYEAAAISGIEISLEDLKALISIAQDKSKKKKRRGK
ncbi:MAG: hypothetical protein ACUVRA_06655 [Candidatus Bathyarchaeaceae archaeon]